MVGTVYDILLDYNKVTKKFFARKQANGGMEPLKNDQTEWE